MKRILALLLCAVMAFSLMAGCSTNKDADEPDESTGSDVSPETEAKDEITVMVPDWAVPTDEMLDEFESETGIGVTISTVGWDDIRGKIAIAAAGGAAAADVVEVDWSWLGEFDAANWLEPLDVPDEDKEDMPTLTAFTAADGRVLAMPYANDFRLAYYNTEMFEEAGIEKAPETWDEVYDAMVKLKTSGVCEYPFAMPMNADESATTSMIWMAFANFGQVFNEDRTLNEEAVSFALSYLNRMVEEGLCDPTIKTASGMEVYHKLTAGEAAFIVGPTSFVSRVNDPSESAVVGKVQPILLPGKEAPSEKTFALPEGVGVTSFSQHKEAAKKYVAWFTSPETQVKLNAAQNAIPTRSSILEKLIEEEVLKNTGAMLEESYRIASPFPGGVPEYYSEMSNAIYNEINAMVLGNVTPEEAFKNMSAKVSELAAR